ncbi:hypothetical protein ILUMI_11509 [Ignelater luminosus]|uniref:SCAN domain-containing protein n=1 Tax=Ignelater luminosus TaxID=2038154 RepID=A0A8K0D1A4_IGNLU|nr:hypothetical protein ILUMI_11509 [Ignelater luminosus]
MSLTCKIVTGRPRHPANQGSVERSNQNAEAMLFASEGEAVDRKKTFCVVCGMESTGTHLCDISKNPVHAVCGRTVAEKGHGSRILCYLCQKEGNIKEQREHAPQNKKGFAEKMKDNSSKKFKDLLVGSTVLIDVPKVDRGPLDANNITEIVLNIKKIFRIGTSVGIKY